MRAEDLKGRLIGARGNKVLSLYSNFSAPFKLKQKITTRGGILSKVVDVQGRPTSAGNELMIGLEDPTGTSWMLYEPGLFFYGGKTEGDPQSRFINIDESSISKLAEQNSLLNTVTAPIKKYAFIGIAIIAGIMLLRKAR